jgi:hypothetical protein
MRTFARNEPAPVKPRVAVAVVAPRRVGSATEDEGPGAAPLRCFGTARFPVDLVARGLLPRDTARFRVGCLAMTPSMSTMEQSESLPRPGGCTVVVRSKRVMVAVCLHRHMELELLLHAVGPVEPLSDKVTRIARLEID